MELNFEELKNTNNSYENNDYKSQEIPNVESQKYWEQNVQLNKNSQPKKKKVTFTDILNNMNLVVNNQGVLQFMGPANSVNEQQYQPQYPQQQYQPQYPPQYPPQYQPQQAVRKIEPLDPSVKHSYIYNKYFKDYKDVNTPKPVKVPKTKEEYIQMVLEERTRQIEERKRISQIKSKKMMFTSNYANPGNIQASRNTLRRMSFN
jgi:hypothetical protein